MTDRIEPALSAEKWLEALANIAVSGGDARSILDIAFESDPARAIAILNAALPDSDRRKITREKLDDLESCVGWARGEGQADLADRVEQTVRALKSYLPRTQA